jgi:hypothetical protein
MKRFAQHGISTVVLGTILAACGSAPATNGNAGGAGGRAAAGAGGAHPTGPGGTGGKVDNLGGSFTTGAAAGTGSSGSGSGGAGETCAGVTSQAELVPLDIYLMLDSSGSMSETTGAMGTGPSKWAAVTQALDAFFADPQSAGLGVGLQHFPRLGAGVPTTCTASSQCPAQAGPCLLKVCSGQGSVVPCLQDADCPGSHTCVKLGHCGSELCAPANGALCPDNGQPCQPLTSSTCAHADSCVAADYGAPAVEIAALNGAAAALSSAIAGVTPSGATPTAPALSGAITHAQAWAAQHPTHTVIVLLATDGLPTECSPQDIPSIAQIAAAGLVGASGAPGVKTFAIGVFAPADISAGAPQNLDQLAAAGGTTKSFVVDTSQNVEASFLAALNAIRGTKLACEYAIPPAGSSGALDFGKVNTEYTPSGGSAPTTVGYVPDLAGCDPTQGGWYYDADPAQGGTPTKIIMCPATCAGFGTDTGGQVDIRVGCKTVLAPPPK